jgi:hypothetical protein
MHLDRFINSPTGKVLTSIILGIGLASLFRMSCKGKNCVILNAPPIDEIKNKVYQYESNPTDCFKYEVTSIKCDKNKKIYSYE